MARRAGRGSIIGVIATILIGAAVVTYVVNMLFDTILSTSTSNNTNSTIASVRPIVNAAIIMLAMIAIVVSAAQMMGALGGIS